ncbi:MAG: substrate-binding periplasmic protein [Pseudomonadota bacterium]
MTNIKQLAVVGLAICSFSTTAAVDIQAGMATGYPPYQFKHEGELSGFDVAVIQAISDELGETIDLSQYDWDNVVSLLRYGELDVAIGMEATNVRRQYFDFTTPYYHRQTSLFILRSNTQITTVRQLIGKRISGDRHSALELHLKDLGLRDAIRIEQADSKKEAMAQLAVGEVEAVIMPSRVAFYLAEQHGIKLDILWQPNDSTPVAMAVSKGNRELLERLEKALAELEQNGTLSKLKKRWDITPPENDLSYFQLR